MSWFDILKELSPRERMDAEDFAPEEMQEWRDEKAKKEYEGMAKVIAWFLNDLKENPDMDEERFRNTRNSITAFIRSHPFAPRIRGRNQEQIIALLTNFLDVLNNETA